MRYNLHTHTYRCNHASGDDREYVEAAIKAGMKTLAEYVESLRALKKEYRDDIEILIGFETEYYPETFDKFRDFIAGLDLDYMIMGQHFIHNEYDVPGYRASDPSCEDARQYVEQTLEGLRTGLFTYIAHPDILRHSDPVFYRELMKEYCSQLKEMDIPIEYNILGYRNKKWYPNPLFWQVAAETGNKVVLGYDAHEPGALLEENNFDACMGYLNMLGITPARFSEIKIRKL